MGGGGGGCDTVSLVILCVVRGEGGAVIKFPWVFCVVRGGGGL